MKKLIWKLRCTYYYMTIAKTGFSLGWYLASAYVDNYDWQDTHPYDAMCEELSCWDADE